MSDTYLNSLLGENEQVLFMMHQHWLVLAGEILSESLLSVMLVVLVPNIWAMLVPNVIATFGYLLLVFLLISLWQGRSHLVESRVSGDQPPRDPALRRVQQEHHRFLAGERQ